MTDEIGVEMRKELSKSVNRAWLTDVGRQMKDKLANAGFRNLSARFKYCLGLITDDEAKYLGLSESEINELKRTETIVECYSKVKELVNLPLIYRDIWKSPKGVAVSEEELRRVTKL